MLQNKPDVVNMTGGAFLPRVISWNMTLRCNLRCPHCYIDAGEHAGNEESHHRPGKTAH